MGAKTVALFNEAGRVGGLVGRMRLASLSRLTSSEAQSCQDDTEVVERVSAALQAVKAQLPPQSTALPAGVVARNAQNDVTLYEQPGAPALLRDYLSAYLDLMSQRDLFMSDTRSTLQRVTETASAVLEVARASVWYSDDSCSEIRCADLFVQGENRHSEGTVLKASDFGEYFRALVAQRSILAHDARIDPRTRCFADVYLDPLGIASMLDVPIWVNGAMVGVVCLEHVGAVRTWTSDEEMFVHLMSNLIGLSLERAALCSSAVVPDA